jgi:hypothetical protein
MDYIIKNRLQNKYPSILNYNTDDGGYIYLDGAFSKENYVAWKKPKISQLKYTPNTSFRFIVEFKTSENDKYSKFYTSEAYYKDLVTSQKENNPYFSKASFRKNSIIVININQLITQRFEMDSIEGNVGVRVTKNILFDANFTTADENMYGINYDAFVEYIDWLIKQDTIYNPKTGGVIEAQQLGVWNTGIWNRITNTYQSEEEYNFFIYKKTLEDQLKGVDDVIASLEFLYENPDSDVAITLVDRAIGAFKVTGALALAGGAYIAVGAVSAAAAGAALVAGGVAGASAIGPIAAIGGALGPIGWAAAAVVIVATALLTFFSKKSDDKQKEEKIKAIKKYCLEEIDKFKRLRELTLADLNNAKKLEPEARKPIMLVNSDTTKLKQTAFEYDDERFQTKNERRIYSANMRVPVTFTVEPATKGVLTKKTAAVEPDANVTPEFGNITTNK